MDKATRDAIGKTLYDASMNWTDSRTPVWSAILNKEEWIQKAECAIDAYEKLHKPQRKLLKDQTDQEISNSLGDETQTKWENTL